MRWKGREQSGNVEDRRGVSPRMAVGGGGLGLLLIIGIAFLFDPKIAQKLLGQIQQQQQAQQQQQPPGERNPGEPDDEGEFIKVVLRDTEKVWGKLFSEKRATYRPPQLVMFTGTVDSACGLASAELGPFYCPRDQKVYIDPSFFEELAKRHKAGGDFAAAYVLAHEVSHHVQLLVGFNKRVEDVRAQGNELKSNQASVRLELQADFLAGVWAHHAHKEYGVLEQGDLEEAINAANRIGDDTLMRESTGYVNKDRFTHGTSKQRAYWFKKGLQSGSFDDCEELFELAYDDL